MKSKMIALSLGAAFLFNLTPSFACMSAASGWYLEITGGRSKHFDYDSGPLSKDTVGIAGTASVGYKFMPFFAAELGYSRYSTDKLKFGDTTVIKNRPYSYQLVGKGIVPIANSGFEPFAKLGVTRIQDRKHVEDQTTATALGVNTSNKTHTGLYLGAGIQYYFMPELAVLVEWTRSQGSKHSTGSFDLYSVGLSFLFD